MSDRSRPAVVLVADRTLAGGYRVLFEGIFATMQTTQVPSLLMRLLLSPRVRTDAAGRAHTAPLGLRRVEAALRDRGGLSGDDVVCTTPEALPKLLGPWTKLVGVSSSDPLGRGMSNTTTKNFQRGRLYTEAWTDRLMRTVSAARDRCGFRVLFGGAGAWQYAGDAEARERHGIDCLFEGAFERQGPGVVGGALGGEALPGHVRECDPCADLVSPICGPSAMGVVELSRGCGRGCSFCASAHVPMRHLPAETILADLETNVSGGVRTVVNGSEDFFRYGGTGAEVNFEALHALLTRMREVRGLSLMQIDHANVGSVLQLSDEQLREVRRLLSWDARTDYLWVNLGVESASGERVAASAPGKAAPFGLEDWDGLVREAAERLTRTGFFPVFSLVLGLPGETPEDVARTRRLVEHLADKPCVIFPVFHEPPPESGRRAFTIADMRSDHVELFASCYELNFRRVPKLVWDNQRAGRVPWVRRAMVQVLGRGEVLLWRRRFRKLRKAKAST